MSAVNTSDSLIRDSPLVANMNSPLNGAINNIGMTLGYGSSMRQKFYKILNAPGSLSDLGPRIFYEIHEWIEKKEVTLYAPVKSAFSRLPTSPG